MNTFPLNSWHNRSSKPVCAFFVPEQAESDYEKDDNKENLTVTTQVRTLMDLFFFFLRNKRICLFAFTFKDL